MAQKTFIWTREISKASGTEVSESAEELLESLKREFHDDNVGISCNEVIFSVVDLEDLLPRMTR